METLALLLMLLTASGYSHVLQPRPAVTQLALQDRNLLQLRDVSTSVEEKEKAARSTERSKSGEEQRGKGLTPETNTEKERMQENRDGLAGETIETLKANKRYEKGGEGRSTLQTSSKILERKGLFMGDEVQTVKAIITDDTKETRKTPDSHNTWTHEERMDGGTHEVFKKSDQMDKLRREIVEEERASELVAGISPREEIRGGELLVNQENVDERGGNEDREKREDEGESMKTHNEAVERAEGDHIVVSSLTPPSSTSSTQLREKLRIPTTIQIITKHDNPSTSPPSVHHHNAPPSLAVTPTPAPPAYSRPPTLHAKVSPEFFPPSLPNPTTTGHISVVPGQLSLFEDLLTEVLQSPGHHPVHTEVEVKALPDVEDVMVKNILFKPAQKELQTTSQINAVAQPKEVEFIPKVQAATPKATEGEFITKDLESKESNAMTKSYKNNPAAEAVELTRKPNTPQATGKPGTVRLMENDTKLTAKPNEASPARPRLTKPSAKTQPMTAKTPLVRPTKINRGSKNKTIKKSKEKKKKKDNKTQKPPEKKKAVTPTHFPYFLDNYCPPECACYGRVVQCSDKGVDKVPYGIPYNARYILLMNNDIDSIQLDLLSEYISMEFLVLSNNRLTDGSIEGAFEGIPALKRLYLDRNHLESVPTDLPGSLEELRLDNNQLGVMSEAAWARCPGLLVLSLSNNSLGNGSDSLPNAVLSPLHHLRTLNLDHNQLKSVPLGLPLSIKELYLKGNLIEHFRGGAFDGISELVVLDLSANRITNKGLVRDSLLNTTHLESLNLEGNRLKQVPRHLPRSLKTLNLEGNLISSIKKAALGILKNLEHLGLARNKIFKVAPGAFRTLPVLHQLDLCHNTLQQVPRQLPQALHSVALAHNKIHSVPRDAFCWGDRSLGLSGLVRVQLEHNLIDMGKLDAQAFRCLRGFQVVHFY